MGDEDVDPTGFPPGRAGGTLRRVVAGVVLATALFAASVLALSRGWQDAIAERLASGGVPVGPVARERYRWRPVAIGGGGFITGMSSDRTGRTWVVRSDVYGAYRWDAGLDRWVQMVTADSMPAAYAVQDGLNEGVYALAVAPGDARRVYMAIKGRMFRSDDGGRRFVEPARGAPFPLSFDPNSSFRLGGAFMAVSPADPSLVLFGTPENGLWRSADAGRSWQRVVSVPVARDLRPGPGVQAPGIGVWFVRSGKGGALHAVAASPGNGVFVADGAATRFVPLGSGTGPRPLTVTRAGAAPDGSFWVADSEAKKLWAWRGGRWRDLVAEHRLPAKAWQDVTASADGRTMLAIDDGGRFWCSADRGERWTTTARTYVPGAGEPPWLKVIDLGYVATAQIAFDPGHPGKLVTAMGVGVYDATVKPGCPGRIDWTSRVRGIEEIVANDVTQPPGQPPLFSGWDFGIHRKPDPDAFSTTYGPKPRVLIAAQQVDWSAGHPSFLVTNASDTRMGCCSEDGDAVLAGYSLDGGVTWQKFATRPVPPGTRPDDPWRMAFGSIAVAADDVDTIVWAPAYDRSPFYTRDRGRSWQRVVLTGEQLPLTGSYPRHFPNRKTLAADRVAPGTFYLYHSGNGANHALAGLWRTTDHAAHWRKVFDGEIAPNSLYAVKLRAVPGHAGHLFFTTGVAEGDTRLRRSTDGGATWTIMERLTRVDDIGFGKGAAGAGYPSIYLSGRVDDRYGIWRSIDGGASWDRLAGLPLGRLDQAVAVAGDPDRFGRVYVGYKGSGWIYGDPAPCRQADPRKGEQCDAVER